MPLTKARPPVTQISQMFNGTTVIDIPTSASDIDIDVAGLDVIDLGSTLITIDDLVTLVANTITGETANLSTTAGAAATLQTRATDARLRTTSAHPLILGANALDALTAETTGRVTLGTVGTLAAELIDKNYVDTTIAAQIISGDGNGMTTGHVNILNDSGNDIIINWGVSPSISNTQTAVVFDLAFPNAAFTAVATRQNGTASLESAAHINGLTQTGMNVVNSGGTSSPIGYIAIGN